MILELLKNLKGVEIEPHGEEVFDPEAAVQEGFELLGTLSPDLQRLGTLLNQQRKRLAFEFEAYKSRKKEASESASLSMEERLKIVEKELPSRLTELEWLNICISYLHKLFEVEMSQELKSRYEEPTVFLRKVFKGWEVAVKPISDIRYLRQPLQDNTKAEETPRHAHAYGKGKTHHFTSGKHGEA